MVRKRKKPPHWAETFHISEIPCEVFAPRVCYFLAAFFFGAAFFTAFFFTGIECLLRTFSLEVKVWIVGSFEPFLAYEHPLAGYSLLLTPYFVGRCVVCQ